MDQIIQKLFELSNLAKFDVSSIEHRRPLFHKLLHQSKNFKAIIGPRGVGKTTLLRQLTCEFKDSIYISMDSVQSDENLFELCKKLSQHYGIRVILIDEIHFNQNFEQYLKNIYDFLQVQIYFTSSSALSLSKSEIDLARRVDIFPLHIFSFWEYLKLKGININPLTFAEIIERKYTNSLNQLALYFDDYLIKGCLPYAQHSQNYLANQKNIISTVVEKDISNIAPIHQQEIFLIKKIIQFVSQSGADGVNYTTLSKNIGITVYKAQQYVELLSRAFILNVSFPHGANVVKEPKILMYLPNRLVFASYEKSLGALREDFVTTMFRVLQMEYSYLKSTKGKKTPDFLVEYDGKKIIIEVGGKNKGREQFKELNNFDYKIILKHGTELKENDIPLFMLGLCAMT